MEIIEDIRYIRDGFNKRIKLLSRAVSDINSLIDNLDKIEKLDKSLVDDLNKTEQIEVGD